MTDYSLLSTEFVKVRSVDIVSWTGELCSVLLYEQGEIDLRKEGGG